MKKVLLVLGLCTLAFILAVAIFILTFDINAYKPRIEAAASKATGMEVSINGKLKLILFPHTGISLEDIIIRNQSKDLASAKKVELKISLLTLLRRAVIIKRVRLITPIFFITKDRRGCFNFEIPEKSSGKELMKPFEVEEIFIKKGKVLYLDEKSGGKIEANECNLVSRNFSAGGGKFLHTLSFEGDLSCGEIKAKEFRTSGISAFVKVRSGKFEANPVTMKIFGGDGRGSIKGAMIGESPTYSVDFTITKFRFEEVLETFKKKESIRGIMDLKYCFTMKGKDSHEMTKTLQGEISSRDRISFSKA